MDDRATSATINGDGLEFGDFLECAVEKNAGKCADGIFIPSVAL